MIQAVTRAMLRLLFRVEVRGTVEPHERMLIVGNHQSFLDVLLLWAFLPVKPIWLVHTTIAAKWMFRLPLRFVKHLVVDTASPWAIKSMVNLVESGAERACVSRRPHHHLRRHDEDLRRAGVRRRQDRRRRGPGDHPGRGVLAFQPYGSRISQKDVPAHHAHHRPRRAHPHARGAHGQASPPSGQRAIAPHPASQPGRLASACHHPPGRARCHGSVRTRPGHARRHALQRAELRTDSQGQSGPGTPGRKILLRRRIRRRADAQREHHGFAAAGHHRHAPRAGHSQLHGRLERYAGSLPALRRARAGHLARVLRKEQAGRRGRQDRRRAVALSRRSPAAIRVGRQALAGLLGATLSPPRHAEGAPRRSRRRAVYLRQRGQTQGRGAEPRRHPGQYRTTARRHRRLPARQVLDLAAAVPRLRLDGGRVSAVGLRRAHLRLPVPAALPHGARDGLRPRLHHHVRHQHLPGQLRQVRPSRSICTRSATSARAPKS